MSWLKKLQKNDSWERPEAVAQKGITELYVQIEESINRRQCRDRRVQKEKPF